MITKGTEVNATEEFSQSYGPQYSDSTAIRFTIYDTSKYDATYCDEPEMNLLGTFDVDLPDVHLGMNRSVLLSLCFGSMEIFVQAKNEKNGNVHRTKFSSSE